MGTVWPAILVSTEGAQCLVLHRDTKGSIVSSLSVAGNVRTYPSGIFAPLESPLRSPSLGKNFFFANKDPYLPYLGLSAELLSSVSLLAFHPLFLPLSHQWDRVHISRTDSVDHLDPPIKEQNFKAFSRVPLFKWKFVGSFACKKRGWEGTSLVAQWLRLHTPNAGGPGSIPGRGTRSHTHATTKSSHAATKDPACHN